MNLPQTDLTLLARLKDPADQLAWGEFVELYRPAIVRLAARKGFQPADRDDLAQNVFLAVAGAITRWQPDGQRARFRTWLFTIASRAVIDAVRRRARLPLCGGPAIQQRLDEQQERAADSRLLRCELRREIFRRAAEAVRGEFEPATWQAFWLVAVEGVGVGEAAARVGKSVGAVYAARARVARRLMDKVGELDRDWSISQLEG